MSLDSLMPKTLPDPTLAGPVTIAGTVTVTGTVNANVLTMPTPVSVTPYPQVVGQLTNYIVDCAAAGNNVLVAAAPGQVIRVYRMFIVFAAADTAYFRNGAAGAGFTGAMTMTQGGSIVLDFDGEPWFETDDGVAFILNMTAGVQASGRIYYTQA